MTFLTYKRGRTTYTVCGRCYAYYMGEFAHDCSRDWTRFLRGCTCSPCREFNAWLTAGNTSPHS